MFPNIMQLLMSGGAGIPNPAGYTASPQAAAAIANGGGTPPAGSMQGMGGLASALGAVQSPNVERQPMAPATFPNQPMSMNPAFTQMVMQALQGIAPMQMPGLGSLMAGGM